MNSTRAGLQMLGGMPRNEAVEMMIKAASGTMDHTDDDMDGAA